MESLNDNVRSFLDGQGISVEEIESKIPEAAKQQGVLFSGAIAEGLGHAVSDIDIIVLGSEPIKSDIVVSTVEYDETVDRLSTGHLLNITYIRSETLEDIASKTIHLVGLLNPTSSGLLWYTLSDAELRLMHDIKVGYPLYRPDLCEKVRADLLLVFLHLYTTVHYGLRAQQLLEDAQTFAASGEDETARLMLHEAAQFLAASVLGGIGQTSVKPKWRVKLLRANEGLIGSEAVDILVESIIGTFVRAIADQIEMFRLAKLKLDADRNARLPEIAPFMAVVEQAMN